MNETKAIEGEVVEREFNPDIGALEVLNKSEINVQIATAKRYPRSVTKFQSEATSLVTLNDETAEGCVYALPRDGKTIEGPSARFAEVVAYAWGNCRAAARVVSEDEEFVTAQGVFWDLEKNTAIGYEVKRRITDKHGKRFKLDMIGMTANAASSIALRNAILKGVPKAIWAPAYEKARETIMGDFETLANRRATALASFQKFGVSPEQIFEKLAVRGEEDISLEHILVLRGLITAIRENDTTVEESFPPKQPQGERGAGAAVKSVLGISGTALQDAKAALAKCQDGEAIRLHAETLPETIRNDDTFALAVRKRLEELAAANREPVAEAKTEGEASSGEAGGLATGTPKLRKQYLERMTKCDLADTLDVIMDETRGFSWAKDDLQALAVAYQKRKAELTK